MLTAADLTREQLESIVESVQNILFYNNREGRWDHDNEWNSQTIEYVAEVLDEYSLRPTRSNNEA